MKILTEFHTSKWSKGETTELYISPESASLTKRDFDFRISIATINGESTFTPFDGFSRVLTLLEGELELIHKGNHTTNLLPFDQDYFKGAWTTKSFGIAKDFNVICKEELEPFVEVMHLKAGQNRALDAIENDRIIYVEEGQVEIGEEKIQSESLILLDNSSVHIKTDISSIIIICSFENIH